MAHSLTITPATAIPLSSSKSKKTAIHIPSITIGCHKDSKQVSYSNVINRRRVGLGLGSVLLGLTIGGDKSANAARRLPPPPPEEKKDPSISGVQAKVIASKKRKEAMKESIAKLREKGKLINEPSNPINVNEPPK